MRTKSVVLYEFGQPVKVEELELASPAHDEALVRVMNAGVCHSDLHVRNGLFPMKLPRVLGHEGAGIVEEVGAGVKSIKPGDHVMLLWITACNKCYYCATGRPALCEEHAKNARMGSMPDGTYRFFAGDRPINQNAFNGCMSQFTVMKEGALLPISKDIPMPIAAIVDCAVMTGVGAVIKTAQVQEGSTVAIFGMGGVGLSGVMGARLANAYKIIGIDVKADKLEMARKAGATDVVNAAEVDPVQAIKDLTGGRGVDSAFEMIGNAKVVEQAFEATARGGQTVIVGAASNEARISLPPRIFQLQERVVRGSLYGSAQLWSDIPRLLNLYRDGRLPLDMLITRHYQIDDVNEAFRALEAGEVAARCVLDMHPN